MSRLLSTLGICATLAYLALLGVLFHGRVGELLVLEPNHLGDFLAGAFGPLAILWLILGFFQQGVELRENSRALDLQAQELKNATREQRELMTVLREHFEATRAEIAAARGETPPGPARLPPRPDAR